jgi:hypothetical protein
MRVEMSTSTYINKSSNDLTLDEMAITLKVYEYLSAEYPHLKWERRYKQLQRGQPQGGGKTVLLCAPQPNDNYVIVTLYFANNMWTVVGDLNWCTQFYTIDEKTETEIITHAPDMDKIKRAVDALLDRYASEQALYADDE